MFFYRRRYVGPLQAVIFDWAGTTIDYGSQAPAMVFIEVFRRNGVEITLDEARQPMGMAKRKHIQVITEMRRVAKRWQDVHGRPPGEADVDALYEAFIPLQLEALPDYARLIPGTLETAEEIRRQGMLIGSNTGYDREMVSIVLHEARRQGFEVDSTVCASDVPAGRPEPWMSLLNAQQMRVYPMEAVVKVDDTIPGIEEGLNAGMWTIGVAKTGNEIGLNEAEIKALSDKDRQSRLERAYRKMAQAGAHYVVDGIWDVAAVLAEINERLASRH